MILIPEHPLVEYTVTFRVPESHVEQEVDESLRKAIRRAATQMLLRLTDQYGYDHHHDKEDQYLVTMRVEREDDPGKPHAEERINKIFTVMIRMLAQRCLDPENGEVLDIELHSDKEALELLAANNRMGMSDREGKIKGFLQY